MSERNKHIKIIICFNKKLMKTGKNVNNKRRNLSERFCIVLLGLDAILKRYGFKDSVLFKNHNPQYVMNPDLFASGVCFNLFSQYGVGKKIEPLIKELFAKDKIIENKDSVFFREIVSLANTITPLIREADSVKETNWTYKYAIESLNKVDNISIERLDRLIVLFDDLSGIIDFNETEYGMKDVEDDNDEIDIEELNDINYELNEETIELEYCNCGFCQEFRQYHFPRDQHIDRIIIDLLLKYL